MNKIQCLIFSSLFCSFLHAQVGIGTTTPDTTSILELSSTTRGFLLPRMTTSQRDAILDPAPGLQLLNTDDYCLDIFDGNHWIKNCGYRLISNDTIPTWTRLTDFPQTGRYAAVGFALNGKGYLGTGRTGVTYYNDLWEFDPVTYAWTQKANVGGGIRAHAVGMATSTKGYIGVGQFFPTGAGNDFWEYDPVVNSWTQKANVPGDGRINATGFVLSEKCYVGSGTPGQDFWEFNPVTNSWVQKANTPVNTVGLTATTYNNEGYVGAPGNALYKFNPILNQWTNLGTIPGSGVQSFSSAFTLGDKIYFGLGASTAFPTKIYAYLPANSTFIQLDDFPSLGRHSAVNFTIANKAYVCTGLQLGGGTTNEVWAFQSDAVYANYAHTIEDDSIHGLTDGIWQKEFEKIFTPGSEFVGIGKSNPKNQLDIQAGMQRFGTHAEGLPLYVTGAIGAESNGIEFRHANGTQGIGFGYSTIYATGNSTSQDLRFKSRGSGGSLQFITNSAEMVRINSTGVGINTNAPHALLHLGGAATNRKIILQETANDDHQFTGLGINTNLFRYQVNATTSDHVFYAGVSASVSNELLRIKGSGYVGIGTAAPNAPLQFSNAGSNRKIVLAETVNNDHQFTGLGLNTGLMRYQVDATTSDHAFYAGASASTSNELMRIKGNGNIGMGTSTPNAPLQFANATGNRKIVLAETADNDHQFTGLGLNTGLMRYQVNATASDHVFYAGSSTTTSNELMRIKGNGYVGIGTSTPNAPLQFANTSMNRKIVLREMLHNDHQYSGFGFNFNTMMYHTESTSVDHVFYAGTSASNSNELMRIKGNGNVGIGMSAPGAPLQFANTPANRKIVFHEMGSNDHQYTGLGTSAAGFRYQVGATANDHIFYAGASSSTSNELMRIKGTGNVIVAGEIESEAYIAPTLLNGFSNAGGEYATAGYYKDKMGIVHLRGRIVLAADPDNLNVFVLPAGYRPTTSGRLGFIAPNNSNLAVLDILADGSVKVMSGGAGSIALDGISFRAD